MTSSILTNSCFAWGFNRWGQCGSTVAQIDIPNEVKYHTSSDCPVCASAGHTSSFIVLKSGVVLAWGREDLVAIACGFRGSGSNPMPSSADRHLPRPLHGLVRFGRVIQISCGASFAVAVMAASGRIVAWGENRHGQLGRAIDPCAPNQQFHGPGWINLDGDNDGEKTEHEIVVAVHCGFQFAAVLTSRGEIYSWGSNSHGQLARRVTGFAARSFSTSPSPVDRPVGEHEGDVAPEFGQAHGLACGDYHLLIIGTAGSLFAAGATEYGRLGHALSHANQASRRGPEGSEKLHHVKLAGSACSRVFAGSACSFAVCTAGKLWGWGFNGAGNLGLGDFLNRSSPTIVDLPEGAQVEELAVGEEHCIAVISGAIGGGGGGGEQQETNEGRQESSRQIMAWGRSSEGRLGQHGIHSEHVTSPMRIEPPNCAAFHSSTDCTFGVSSSGSHTLAWCSEGPKQ